MSDGEVADGIVPQLHHIVQLDLYISTGDGAHRGGRPVLATFHLRTHTHTLIHSTQHTTTGGFRPCPALLGWSA